jgi:hypothetical protein
VAKQVDDWGEFELLTPEVNANSIIASSQGAAGSGKSHFWLTAPGPIAYFLFDPGGLKGLRNNPLFSEKEVRVQDYCSRANIAKLPRDERVQRSLEILQAFQEDWNRAVKLAKTLVIDKESLLWEIIRYAHNEVDSPTPKDFHELNLMYRGWVQDAENNGVNLGLIRDMHDTWGKIGVSRDGRPQQGFTGKYRPDGQKYVPGLVQINLEHRWDEDSREFYVKILEKCRLGEAKRLMSKEFPEMDFPMLGQLLFAGTTEEDWQ